MRKNIELTCKYNFEKDMLDLNKTITHKYLSLENCYEKTTDSYTEELTNASEIISRLEENDLK